MELAIHAQHVDLTPALRRYVVENLQEPVEGIFRRSGLRMEVFLRDVRGGQKSGLDQECRCTLQIPLGPKLVITELTDDMRTSIHQARRRLMRRLRAHQTRRNATERRPRKQYFARTLDTELVTRARRAEDVRGTRESHR